MKCSLLTLSCALDGELSRERQAELDAHLITCERCRTGMRYLREETERISLLSPVHLSDDKATALLERARVLIAVTGHPPTNGFESSVAEPAQEPRAAPDPFDAMGLEAAIIDLPLASAASRAGGAGRGSGVDGRVRRRRSRARARKRVRGYRSRPICSRRHRGGSRLALAARTHLRTARR